MPFKRTGLCVKNMDSGESKGCSDSIAKAKRHLTALNINTHDVKEEEKIKGGKADYKTPAEIAKLHKVSLEKIESQIKKGIKVELEHVDSEAEAREIAMDHLVEMPDYYDRLNKMENKADKEEKTTDITESTKGLIKRLIRENLLKK